MLALSGCLGQPEPPPPQVSPEVTLEPEQDGTVAPIVRITLSFAERMPSIARVRLFSGELTEAQLGRIDRLDVPATLLQREVSLIGWRSAPSAIVFAPAVRLTPGAGYTLAAPGHGRLARFWVAERWTEPIIERFWPPAGVPSGGWVVLCGHDMPSQEIAVEVAPPFARASYRPDLGEHQGRSCARIDFDAVDLTGQTLVLPATLMGRLVDAEPLAVEKPETGPYLECAAAEHELGPGCVEVQDDRLRVRGPARASLWRVELLGRSELRILPPDGEFVLRGLAPQSTFQLRGSEFDLSGNELPFAIEVLTRPPRARVLLNEVLANPLSAEPANEWIELYNDGSAAADLAEVRLLDPGSVVALPSVELEPGSFALLVREDFVGGGLDVPLAAGTLVIRLPQLGKNGLSNSGEPLALVDPSGAAFSSFPALRARRAGFSIARVNPDAPDDRAESFAEHAPPGASPGSENQLSEAP